MLLPEYGWHGVWIEKRKWGEKMSEQEKQIEKQNKKIEHWLWIIFVSMITSIITTILATM